MKIDKIDKNILNILLKDSKASYREVAKKVGVSVVTIMKRVKALEKENIINYFTAHLDYEKLGYDLTVIIKLRVSKGKTIETLNKLSSDPHVFAMYDTTGHFDAMIVAKFKNRKSMDSFLKKIQNQTYVVRTETNLVLNTVKEENIKVD